MPRTGLFPVLFMIAVLATLHPCTATAQQAIAREGTAPRLRFSVGGGFANSPPLGRPGVADLGYHLNAAAELRTPWSPLRVRADALFAHWGGDARYSAVTAGLVARGPERWRAAPYLMAAAGGFAAPAAGIGRGWTLGGGMRVPLGASALLVESRMHAFHVGTRGLERAGIASYEGGYDPWQYTFTPVSVSIQF